MKVGTLLQGFNQIMARGHPSENLGDIPDGGFLGRFRTDITAAIAY
jgi:hypothetical protein